MQTIFSFLKKTLSFLRKKWKLILILAVILVVGSFLFRRSQASKEKVLKTITPEKAHLIKTLDVSGIIDAKDRATLRFAGGGKIVYLGAKEGDLVKRGQAIAKIDTRDLQKRMQQDLNLYFNERMDFDQGVANRTDLAPTNTLNRTAQKEQKNLENSVLDVEVRDITIRNATLSSPLDGILVSNPVSVTGTNVLATDAFEIINPQSLVFRATVDQADIAQVKKGQATEINLDPYPDQKITTTVNYIAYKSSQSSTGTVYIVEMAIPNNYQYSELEHYRLGMNGDAKIILDEKENVLAIPLSTTKERDGKTFVTVKTGDKTTAEKEIHVGLETDDKVEILSGLTENDQVILP
jgi:RND family efflux transporter MFP subunit